MLPFLLLNLAAIAARRSSSGAFCCDKSRNLVNNGNFEYGRWSFGSDYQYHHHIRPGQYYVTHSASNFRAYVRDHSRCRSSIYRYNSKFLLVNGLTNQNTGSKAAIWKQTIRVNRGSKYTFCGNFKNLRQCTYDVRPKVTVQLSTGVRRSVTINTNPRNACDWQKVSFCFSAGHHRSITITILLQQDSLGDGNDLAIDDISVQSLVDPILTTTYQHRWGSNRVLASINSITSRDDRLPYNVRKCRLPWYWYVYTLSNMMVDWRAPFGFGNNYYSVRYNPYAFGPRWYLTTNFPGFQFQWGKMYVFGMITRECCEECINDGWTAHVVLIKGGGFPFGKSAKHPFDKINKQSELEASFWKKGKSPSKKEIEKQSKLHKSSSTSEFKHMLLNENDLKKMIGLVGKFEASKAYKGPNLNEKKKPQFGEVGIEIMK